MADEVDRLCIQRRLNQQFHVPLVRFNPTNPYTPNGPTQAELDMRRKTEILKYASKSMTAKERYTMILKGKYRRVANATDEPCPADETVPTPTSSCDVPGPVVLLQYKPQVPLYNYNSITSRVYGIIEPTLADLWRSIITDGLTVPIATETNLLYLAISKDWGNSPALFSMTIPIILNYSGTSQVTNFTLSSIITATVSVYYSGALVYTYVSPSILSTILVSMDQINTSYSFRKYIGSFLLKNQTLNIIPDGVFTFTIRFGLTNGNINRTNASITLNPETDYINTTLGCSVSAIPNITSIPKFNISVHNEG